MYLDLPKLKAYFLAENPDGDHHKESQQSKGLLGFRLR